MATTRLKFLLSSEGQYLRHSRELSRLSAAGSEYDATDVHLICDDFSDESMSRAAASFRDKHGRYIAAEFSDCNVWEVDGFSKDTVVFYLTERDVRDNQKNGNSDRTKRRCYDLATPYDEYDYFESESFPVRFDSKQNVDKNYAGRLFYYFR